MPELKEIKKEEEELCCSQEVELLLQHQETNTEISHESKDNSQASDEMEHLLRLRIPKIHLHRIGNDDLKFLQGARHKHGQTYTLQTLNNYMF